MKALPICEGGIVIILEAGDLPPPAQDEAIKSLTQPLPHSANDTGWVKYILGVHTDGTLSWYELKSDADPAAKMSCRYWRLYSKPGEKRNPDGVSLWVPREGQRQGSCTFEAVPYT